MAHINVQSMITWLGSVRRSLGKRELAVVLGWSALVAAVLLYDFHSFYQHNAFIMGAARGPAFTDLDMLALLIMGFVAGLLLPEVKKLTYGYLASMAVVSTVGVITIFAYIWYVFQFGLAFQDVPFGWETALLTASVQVGGFMLPIGAVFSLMGVITGNVVSFFAKYA